MVTLQTKTHIKEMWNYEKDDDEIIVEDNPWDVDPQELPDFIEGTEVFKEKMRAVILRHKKAFSSKLNAEPAHVTPMKLRVNKEQWETKANRHPPRAQTQYRQEQTEKHVRACLDAGVIEISDKARAWSQVILTPKKDKDETRFCNDFRALNDATDSAHWPIPNISQMLQRLGKKKAKYYAVLDLTQGFFQVAVAEESKEYLAFNTHMGLYQWKRVPMGTKGAPSHFQRVIAQEVLTNLIYHQCELYIDDVLVFGETEEEFLNNVEAVLTRFEEFNISLKPSKCKFGLSEIEYVGHLIDKDGLTFTKEKLAKVAIVEKPVTTKQLKSFLGLANVFREHVQDHSLISRVLSEKHLVGYQKNKRVVIKWDEESDRAFNTLKDKINNIPKLFFINDHDPVILETDASDLGWGAHLYQVVEGTNRPIAFLSESFRGSQVNWSTFEKECYAGYKSFQKLGYLLRDAKFTWRTDHDNITKMNGELSSRKVYSWKLYMQDFDVIIEHYKGTLNVAADGLSRLFYASHVYGTESGVESILHDLYIIDDMKIDQDILDKLRNVHNGISGHSGIEKTIARLNQLGQVWSGRRSHVKQFIKLCPCCQKFRDVKLCIDTIPFCTAEYSPFSRMSWDTLTGLPIDAEGYCKLLVGICHFTRFLLLFALKTEKASECLEHLMQTAGLFGMSSTFQSDNGPQFANKLVQAFNNATGHEQRYTIPYSKEENGMVERANREVLGYLNKIIFDQDIVSKWRLAVPMINRCYNASPNKILGVSPATLVYGSSINLDRGILSEPRIGGEQKNIREWLDEKLSLQKIVLDRAAEAQRTHDKKHILAGMAANDKFEAMEIGDQVLVLPDPHSALRATDKYLPRNVGPMEIIEVTTLDSTIKGADEEQITLPYYKITVRNSNTGRNEVYPHARLRPFYHQRGDDVAQYAAKDGQLYSIDKITKTSKPKGTSYATVSAEDVKFLVKWKDFSDRDCTWETLSDLKNSEALHAYLSTAHQGQLRRLIPRKFRLALEDTP